MHLLKSMGGMSAGGAGAAKNAGAPAKPSYFSSLKLE